MRVLDYAWNTLTSVSNTDYDGVSLVLDESLPQPTIGWDGKRYLIKLPLPKQERDGLYSLQGLYADTDDQNWTSLWRLFRASLYHASFHVLHSDMGCYAQWAKGKDRYAAVYGVSLVEDYKITSLALKDWKPILPDIAYANFVSAIRMRDVHGVPSAALSGALELLLEVWGVASPSRPREEEDAAVLRAGNRIRSLVQRYTFGNAGKEALVEAADVAYRLVDSRGLLSQIPSFPHTEAHSKGGLFESRIVDTGVDANQRLQTAYEALGVDAERDPISPHLPEAKDALQALADATDSRSKLAEHYAGMIGKTRLKGVRFPMGDIGTFMRTRSELAGSIRSIRDQLAQVRNVLDENQGEESGQVDMTAAMQVIASKQVRTDVFVRDQLLMKDEAWAILVDASKSISQVAIQLKGITTCLAEVAKDLMRERSRWGVFAFNDTFQIVKDFDEAYSIDARARIGGLVQEGPTYLPDAIVAASKALSTRPIDSRYLVVVSDCLPTGYAGIEKELGDRIKSVARSGTLLLGVGVQSSAVKKYFSFNCVMTSPYELMKFFAKAYMELSSTAN